MKQLNYCDLEVNNNVLSCKWDVQFSAFWKVKLKFVFCPCFVLRKLHKTLNAGKLALNGIIHSGQRVFGWVIFESVNIGNGLRKSEVKQTNTCFQVFSVHKTLNTLKSLLSTWKNLVQVIHLFELWSFNTFVMKLVLVSNLCNWTCDPTVSLFCCYFCLVKSSSICVGIL